jgi:hypothetical protein
VFPTKWRDVNLKLIRDDFVVRAQLVEGAAKVDGVPENVGGDNETEAGNAVGLVLEREELGTRVSCQKDAGALLHHELTLAAGTSRALVIEPRFMSSIQDHPDLRKKRSAVRAVRHARQPILHVSIS